MSKITLKEVVFSEKAKRISEEAKRISEEAKRISPQSFRETDLYPPVKRYLEYQGYTVRGEVRDCDVVACKADHVIVVELKRALTTLLLIQAVDRQSVADAVYVAVPRPIRANDTHWRGIRRLLQRLELGLLFVSEKSGDHAVILVQQPVAPASRAAGKKAKRARTALLEEFHGRSSDHNSGGSSGRPLVTAYRERAVRIARVLRQHGPQSTRQLRAAFGTGKQTTSILYRNVYDWFAPVARGVYGLTDKGRADLEQFHFITDGRTSDPSG